MYILIIFLDDEDQLREELKDLIDDNPIEESEGEDSDGSDHHKKRKKSDDEDFDDRLEDEDYDLIEENLGVKFERVSLFCIPQYLEEKRRYAGIYKNLIACYRSALSVFEGFKMRNRKRNKKRKPMKREMLLPMNCLKVLET